MSASLFLGCDSGQPQGGADPVGEEAGRREAFTRDLLALKAVEKDQDRLEALTGEIMARHGFAVAPSEAGQAGAATPDQAPAALSKEAAGLRQYQVKDRSGTTYFSHRHSISVGEGKRLSIRVTGKEAADPFLAAYYEVAGSPQVVFVMAQDDSLPSLNPLASWTNYTGETKTIYYVVFASLTTTRGKADVKVYIDGSLVRTETGVVVGGSIRYANTHTANPASGCDANPVDSRFWTESSSSNYSEDLLALNNASYKGVKATMEGTAAYTTSVHIPSGTPYDKEEVVGRNHHWVLAYKATSNSIGGHYLGDYHYIQYDRYTCP